MQEKIGASDFGFPREGAEYLLSKKAFGVSI